MREMEQLPPEERAVLSLVLTQRKSYGEVASMLGISEQSVRERAHTALDALASHGGLAPASGSSPGGSTPGGFTPGDPTTVGASSGAANGSATSTASPEISGFSATSASSVGSPASSGSTPAPMRRSSKAGGAVLLAAIVAAIAVAAILLSGGGKGSGHAASRVATPSTPSSTTTSGSAASGVHIDKRLALTSTDPSLKAAGVGFVLSQGDKRAFYVAAQGLAPSSGFFYAVWLYNSPSDSFPLGRTPAVGSSGRTEGGGALPGNAGGFHKIVITRETNVHPSNPGQIVLSGPFALR
jgi:hypothetical protein